ncbi:MAG: YchJ family metal-binding protein [Pseudomonadota bacterium]
MPCPCGSSLDYEACCEPFHKGAALPPTAETLMRSRYSAFAKQEIAYLKETTWPARRKHFDEAGYRDRAKNSIWLGLAILETSAGQETDSQGTVTFSAKSMMGGEVLDQTEKSLFKKKAGHWYYVKAVG